MFLKKFWQSRSGNFGMMLALTLPTILIGVEFAIDVSKLVSAKANLQAAADSALLAASHLKDTTSSRDEVFNSFLQANVANHGDLSDVKGHMEVVTGLNHIETQATVSGTVELSIIKYFGVSQKLSVVSGAYEATDTLEVALVLDNTGSMGATRMKALREAATALVDILENTKSPSREVKAALVPFVSAVNIKGEGYKEDWIDVDAKAPYHGANFDKKSANKPHNHLDLFKHLKDRDNKVVEWKGCVEARPAPYNLSDDAPDPGNPSTLFVPYFAPDNPGPAAKSPNSGDYWNNSYLGDTIGKSPAGQQKDITRYLAASTDSYIDEKGPRTTGPNYACPTPVQPLTDDFGKLRDAISQMIYWEGGGTNVSEGLAWGMRVLSPGEPYTQGAAFDDAAVSKVVVVFTDGENTVFGASKETTNTSDYGAYSFLDSGRMGTTNRGTALKNVNTWTQTMCTKLKEKGVKVFAVLLGADTKANRDLYSKCVSSPANYYPTSDVSELESVFAKIGTAVTQLYLTH